MSYQSNLKLQTIFFPACCVESSNNRNARGKREQYLRTDCDIETTDNPKSLQDYSKSGSFKSHCRCFLYTSTENHK